MIFFVTTVHLESLTSRNFISVVHGRIGDEKE